MAARQHLTRATASAVTGPEACHVRARPAGVSRTSAIARVSACVLLTRGTGTRAGKLITGVHACVCTGVGACVRTSIGTRIRAGVLITGIYARSCIARSAMAGLQASAVHAARGTLRQASVTASSKACVAATDAGKASVIRAAASALRRAGGSVFSSDANIFRTRHALPAKLYVQVKIVSYFRAGLMTQRRRTGHRDRRPFLDEHLRATQTSEG
jgi:hypothetical protein